MQMCLDLRGAAGSYYSENYDGDIATDGDIAASSCEVCGVA